MSLHLADRFAGIAPFQGYGKADPGPCEIGGVALSPGLTVSWTLSRRAHRVSRAFVRLTMAGPKPRDDNLADR